jgi:EpsI family protein
MRELRLSLVLMFLALPIALGFAGSQGVDRDLGNLDLADAPRQLAGVPAVGDSELEAWVTQHVSPSAYLLRSYSDRQTEAVAYVAFYSGFGSSGAHDPQVCYPAQGFDIGEIRNVQVELADGSRVWSKVFRARQGAYEEVVLHWFQPRDRWAATPMLEPWVRMFHAFRGRKAYAFVRVSVQVDARGLASAEAQAIAMAAELAPWTRAVLSRAASVREEAAQARTQEGRHGYGQVLPGRRDVLQQPARGSGSRGARERLARG